MKRSAVQIIVFCVLLWSILYGLDALYTRLNMLQNNKTFTVDNDTINETAINCERIVDDLAIYIDTMHKIQQG